MQCGETELSCFVSCLFHLQQQGFEFCCPLQALFCCQEGQLAHQMHQTEGMHGIVRQRGGAGHMHPLAVACHIQTGFILMDHAAGDQSLFGLLLDVGQVPGAPRDQVAEGSFAHRDGKQVLHLSALHHAGRDLPQVRLALLTAFHAMHHHLIETRREQQRFAGVALLTTRLLPAFFAQTLGLTAETIRGGGQVAIVAIFGQLLLLPAQFPLQQRDLLLLSIDQCLLQADRFLLQTGLLSQQPILVSQVDQFFFCRHALTLHAFAGFGKSLNASSE
jgi:hypothetical protein